MTSYQLRAHDSTLSFQPDGSLCFALNGEHLWHSEGPLCVLHYYDRQHPRAARVDVPELSSQGFGTAGTPSLGAKAHLGFEPRGERQMRVQVDIEGCDIAFALDFELNRDGSGFGVTIGDDSLVEGNPRLYRVLDVEVLPMFGAAKSGEDGYLLLPNWAGCRTFFDKTYPRELRQTIYSSNDQWENNCNMAVWGITRAQGTLCAFVAQGDLDAELISRVHWEEAHLNASHARLTYRSQQHDERLSGDREVRYAFAPPQNECGEGYVFCGTRYRDFLRSERDVQTWDEKERERPAATRDYLDRFFLKIFLAYKDPQPDGHGAYHATCTFDEARRILEQCLARGMTKLCVALVGWGRDGHDGMRPTQFPVDERLGGESGLRALASWCRDNDIVLGVHDGYGASYSCSPDHNTDDLIRHRSGEYWESIVWSGGQVHLICPQVAWEKHIQRDMPAIRELGLLHHHIDAIGSFVPCFAPEHPLETRAKFIAQVKKMFELSSQTFGGVSTEYPFGPYFSVVDGFFHCYETAHPWQAASAAGRYFLDDMVPLIPIVLHGSHNCLTSLPLDDAKLVQAVDFGLHPQAEVCVRPSKAFGIPSYEEAAERLTQIYHQFYGDYGIANRLKRQDIQARFQLAPGVHRTVYSDGTSVVVNRSSSNFDGLAPQSFRVESDVAAREEIEVEAGV